MRVAEAPMRAVDHQAGRLVTMRRLTRPCLLLASQLLRQWSGCAVQYPLRAIALKARARDTVTLESARQVADPASCTQSPPDSSCSVR